jgi:hypothetical protein
MERISEVGTTLAVTSYLLITAKVVPNSLILSSLMIVAIRSSKTSVLTRITRLHIPEVGIHHSHRREDNKSYTVSVVHIYLNFVYSNSVTGTSGRATRIVAMDPNNEFRRDAPSAFRGGTRRPRRRANCTHSTQKCLTTRQGTVDGATPVTRFSESE